MAIEKTLSIVKPNSTLDNNIGNIIALFEKNRSSYFSCKV